MTDAQKKLYAIQTRMSLHTSRFGVLERKADRTATEQVEFEKLDGGGEPLHLELRSAIAAVEAEAEKTITKNGKVDAETREQAEIRTRFEGVTDFLGSALRGQLPVGAAAEYAASLGCRSHETPIQLVMEATALETRAVTDGPTSGTVLRPTTPAVFPRSIHAGIGVATPIVPPGVAAFPLLATSVAAGAKVMLKGVAADSTAGTMSTKTVSPRRLPGTITVAVEDQAILPTLEMDVTRNLQDVLGNAFDQVVINGQAAVANVAPLIVGVIGFTTAASAESTKDTFANYAEKFLGNFDGILASGPDECLGLVNIATAKHMLKTFSTTAPVSAWKYCSENMRGLRAWKHLAPLASGIGPAYVIQAGVEGRCAAPIWGGLELVRDTFGTNATKGQVSVTATMLVGDVQELRDGFVVPLSVKTV